MPFVQLEFSFSEDGLRCLFEMLCVGDSFTTADQVIYVEASSDLLHFVWENVLEILQVLVNDSSE